MRIGFIGVGKISSALVEGLCTSSIQGAHIYLSPRSEANSRQLAGKYKQVERLTGNQEVVDSSDIIFLAVRPAEATEILQPLRFREAQIIVSLIPQLKKAEILRAVAPATQITRAVPTPAVMLHTGPILVFNSNPVVTELFRYVGQPIEAVDEHQLHVLWTLTGLITPFYDLLTELSDWTVAKGAGMQTANEYIAALFHALCVAAQQSSSINFKQLAKHAETPKGMNEQAGKEIREKGAHEMYRIATDNLFKRFE